MNYIAKLSSILRRENIPIGIGTKLCKDLIPVKTLRQVIRYYNSDDVISTWDNFQKLPSEPPEGCFPLSLIARNCGIMTSSFYAILRIIGYPKPEGKYKNKNHVYDYYNLAKVAELISSNKHLIEKPKDEPIVYQNTGAKFIDNKPWTVPAMDEEVSVFCKMAVEINKRMFYAARAV